MTLADIRTLFAGWLNRTDLTTSLANGFLQRGQARLEREIRVPAMERYVQATPDPSGTLSVINIPYDFLEAQRFEADGRYLQVTTPEDLMTKAGLPPSASFGPYSSLSVVPSSLMGSSPAFVARVQGVYRMIPFPKQYATMYYYGQFSPLIADTDTSTLLDFAPDTLLWAALSFAGDYYRMDEMATWEQRYQADRESLRLLGQDADLGGGPQTVRASHDGGYL